jgi:hypothetical protein
MFIALKSLMFLSFHSVLYLLAIQSVYRKLTCFHIKIMKIVKIYRCYLSYLKMLIVYI